MAQVNKDGTKSLNPADWKYNPTSEYNKLNNRGDVDQAK